MYQKLSSCIKNQKKADIVWLILVFIYISGATGYIFTANIIAGFIMLVNLAIFLSLVYQHHQKTGIWQLPLKRNSLLVSTKDVETNTASKGNSKR